MNHSGWVKQDQWNHVLNTRLFHAEIESSMFLTDLHTWALYAAGPENSLTDLAGGCEFSVDLCKEAVYNAALKILAEEKEAL